jgi:hypothetical protein
MKRTGVTIPALHQHMGTEGFDEDHPDSTTNPYSE